MKTPTLTPEERAQAIAIAAGIRQRLGYSLARAWVHQVQLGLEPTKYPTDVYRIGQAIEAHTGARLDDSTVAVALEDAGIPIVAIVRFRDGTIGGQVQVDERVVLDYLSSKHNGFPLPPGPMRLWGDDIGGTVQ